MLLVLALGIVLLGIGGTPSVAEVENVQQAWTGTLATINSTGVLKVGSDTAYPPFEELNATTGEAQGFDMDIAQLIADKIGEEAGKTITLEVVTSAWEPIIPNLNLGLFDMIISAMTITEEREEVVDFSRWYYQSYQGVLVQAGNPLEIADVDDLNSATITIGVQTGTTSYLYATDNLEDATLKTYDDFPLAIQALKTGEVNVVLGDLAVLALDAAQTGATEVVDQFSPENFGIAMRTNDTDLITIVNDTLDEHLGTNLESPTPSDEYHAAYIKWFGFNMPEYTGTVTLPEVTTAPSAPSPFLEIFVILPGLLGGAILFRKKKK